MKAGLDTLRSVAHHRRIAVLGDMLELGDYAEEAHRIVGEYAASRADLILTFGDYADIICELANVNGSQAMHFESKQSLTDCLLQLLSDGDTVLFKASRGMRFEDIINSIKEKFDEENA